MIHLIGNLYSVEVPSDSKKLIKIKYDFNGNYMLESICDKFKLKIHFDFKILGEVTKDKITFDVEPYVTKITLENNVHRYANYCRFIGATQMYSLWNSHDSFMSLLESKGIDLSKENVKWVILLQNIQQ